MNQVRRFLFCFGLFLLCSCALAAPTIAQHNRFLALAEKNYRAALLRYRAEPNNSDVVWQFARASFDRAEFAVDASERAALAQPAIDACEHALTAHENNAPLHYYLAMDLGQLAQTKGIGALKLVRQMETEFLRAQQLNAEFDYAGADRNVGLLYLNAPGWPASIGNHSKARQHLMRAVQIAPAYPENHLDLLEAYIKLDDDTAAQLEAQKIFELLPQARQRFVGEEWESSWADWESRWQKFESKLAEKPRPQSPHQRK
ncbi:MAG: hypothetical protein ACXWBP_09365 [Limisphaerales bacterium]